MAPVHPQIPAADQIQRVSKMTALTYTAAFAGRLHVCCQCTWTLEYTQAADTAIRDTFVHTGAEMPFEEVKGWIGPSAVSELG